LYTATKETIINIMFRLDHHHIGDKKSKGVNKQWAKQRELDVAPYISEFFNSKTFIFIIYAKEKIIFYFPKK